MWIFWTVRTWPKYKKFKASQDTWYIPACGTHCYKVFPFCKNNFFIGFCINMNLNKFLIIIEISTYINTKMFVCLRFSRPFGIRLGYPLAQMCFDASKWFLNNKISKKVNILRNNGKSSIVP